MTIDMRLMLNGCYIRYDMLAESLIGIYNIGIILQESAPIGATFSLGINNRRGQPDSWVSLL